MSLNRYHKSRASDNVFKLLHEEKTYLDILKDNVKAVHQNDVEEDTGVGSHNTIRQQLLHEQDPGVDAVNDAKVDEEPEEKEDTPEEQEKAAEEAGKEVKGMVENELEEISIAVARQGAQRLAKQKALAARGILRTKGPMKAAKPTKRRVVGLG